MDVLDDWGFPMIGIVEDETFRFLLVERKTKAKCENKVLCIICLVV